MRFSLPQVAMIVGMVSLTFFFGSLILAFELTVAQQALWTHFEFPVSLWAGLGILGLSSAALEYGRYSLKHAHVERYRTLSAAAFGLGVLFLLSQGVAAADLIGQGVAAEANPHGSAFYVFMVFHGGHLAAGITWLAILWRRARALAAAAENDLRRHRRALVAAAMFWHFMGFLWLVMFFFLWRWTAG